MTSLLIVEDETPVAAIMAHWLESTKRPIRRASSAEEALDLMKIDPACVALCDIGLPGHDGLWLVDRLREAYPHTAIVLATAEDALPGSVTLRDGVVAYLLKPFSRTALQQAVEAALTWHQDSATTRGDVRGLQDEARARREWLREQLAARPVVTAADAWALFDRLFLDGEGQEHALRVVALALGASTHLRVSMTADASRAFEWAARFHDLDKLTLPESIIAKSGWLTRAEEALVRRSSAQVYELLKPLPFLAASAEILRDIHEHENGLGYPRGLVGDAVPVASRIIAVTEAWDVLTHRRVHQDMRLPSETAVELRRGAGLQYDGRVVDAVISAAMGQAS